MNGKNILVIGGGLRLEKAAESFGKRGHAVSVFDGSIPLKSAIEKSDIVVLPLPLVSGDIAIEGSSPVSLKDIAMLAGKKRLVAGGLIDERTKALFDVYSVRWADYALSDEFEILNAVPTAEGAIALAMDEFPFTISGAPVLVTGFGKVGRALALRLKALGADVTVAARSAAARAEVTSLAMRAVDFSCLERCAAQCRILFNTVPAKVIDAKVLSALDGESGVIDLASKPGGIDLDSAKALGVYVIWALGLPGKVAPVTAGKIIADAVLAAAGEMRL